MRKSKFQKIRSQYIKQHKRTHPQTVNFNPQIEQTANDETANNNNVPTETSEKDTLFSMCQLSSEKLDAILNENPGLLEALKNVKPTIQQATQREAQERHSGMFKRPKNFKIVDIGRIYLNEAMQADKRWCRVSKTKVGNLPFVVPLGYVCEMTYVGQRFQCRVLLNSLYNEPAYKVTHMETGLCASRKFPSSAWIAVLTMLHQRQRVKKAPTTFDGYVFFGFRTRAFHKATEDLPERHKYVPQLAKLKDQSVRKLSETKPRRRSTQSSGGEKLEPPRAMDNLAPQSPKTKEAPQGPYADEDDDLSDNNNPKKKRKKGSISKSLFPSKTETKPLLDSSQYKVKTAEEQLQDTQTRLERIKQHQQLQEKRIAWWAERGVAAKPTGVRHDILVELNGGTIIEEIKSLDGTKRDQRAQVRLALGQLSDYKQQLEKRHNFKFIQMIAVFTDRIKKRYQRLLEEHNIASCWFTESEFDGTSEAQRIWDEFLTGKLTSTQVLHQHILQCSHCHQHPAITRTESDIPELEEGQSEDEEDVDLQEDQEEDLYEMELEEELLPGSSLVSPSNSNYSSLENMNEVPLMMAQRIPSMESDLDIEQALDSDSDCEDD